MDAFPSLARHLGLSGLSTAVRRISRVLLGTDHPRRLLFSRLKGIRRLFFRQRSTPTQIVETLESLGLHRDGCAFVHASWAEFSNFAGTPSDLIRALVEHLGPQGTLAMPAFPSQDLQRDPGFVFDVLRTPSAAGLLSETFRRYPRVLRSIHHNHSVCALGPNASFLVRDHHKSITSWDEKSPYYRLRDTNALIVGLGVGTLEATALHCVESMLWRDVPFFSMLAQPPIVCRYRDQRGQDGQYEWVPLKGKAIRPAKLRQHIPEYREVGLSGLRVFAVPARALIDTAVALGRKGITMWVDPEPRPDLFTG
jgi:aminoglycoside 3-N-acetyltransferase